MTVGLFSNQIFKLNKYPEFKTKKGIQSIMEYVASIDRNKTPVFPTDLNERQKKRYIEKFSHNFRVQKLKNTYELFYAPKIDDNPKLNANMALLVVTPDMKQKVLEAIYNNPELGLGIGISQFYYQVCSKFINITRKESTDFLKKQGNYQIGLIPQNPIKKPIVAKTSNERWGIDNVDMSRYPEFGKNYVAFLTIVDYFSKRVWAVPVTDLTADTNYKALMSVCKSENTYPRIIQADNGTAFYGDFKTEMTKHNKDNPTQKIKIVYTTPHNPTANGLVERMNRELRKKIRAGFISNNNLLWSNDLYLYELNINNQRSSITKYTPNQLWTEGYHKPKDFIKSLDENPPTKISDHTDINTRRDNLQLTLLKNSVSQFKNQLKGKIFKVGDVVRIKLSAYMKDISLSTQIRSREKDVKNKKYNIVNYTLQTFIISKIFPSKIYTEQELESLANHIPREELQKQLQDKYSLNEKDGDDIYPYIIDVRNKKRTVNDNDEELKEKSYRPLFYSSDLQLVPKDSTPFNIEPSLKRIAKLNTYNYKNKDIVTREAEKIEKEPRNPTLKIVKETVEKEIIPNTRITRSMTKK